METKCTQTKLDDDIFLLPTTEAESQAEDSAEAAQESTTAESKGEIGTWTSSTEVCPWEDE